MGSLFTPAEAVISRVNFTTKTLLMVGFFLIPILYLSSLQLSQSYARAESLQIEHEGIVFINGIRAIYEKVPQHRGLSQTFLKGSAGVKGKLDEIANEVERRFNTLAELNRELAYDLSTGDELKHLHDQWQSLRQRNTSLTAPESFAQHTALIEGLSTFMTHTADRSGLNLDDDTATSYAVRALIEAIPEITEYLGQTRGLGSGIAATGSFTPELFTKLSINVNLIATAQESLTRVTNEAKSAAPAFAAELQQELDAAQTKIDDFTSLVKNQMIDSEQITVDANRVFSDGTSAIGATFALFDTLSATIDSRLTKRAAAAQRHSLIITLVIGVSLILVAYFVVAFHRVIKRTVTLLGEGTRSLAEGRLDTRIDLGVRDELQEVETAINGMAENFGGLINDVKQAASSVNEAATQMGELGATTRQCMENQRAQVSQVATAVNQMAATVGNVAQSAEHSAQATHDAKAQIDEGQNIVAQSRTSIEQLAHEVENASKVINGVESDSDKIGSVLDVIRGIAEQTNLLALNAAIEAARAGEQGRGFAVVADEVRTLAGRTQQSTQEIQQMIERLQQGTSNAVKVMEDGRQQAAASVEQSTNAANALNLITDAISQISDMSGQIATAAKQQNTATEEISQSVVQIDQSSTSTVDTAVHSEQTIQQLVQHAGHLITATAKFVT